MAERKFNVPAIILSAVSIILMLFAMPVESVIAAVISIILAVKKRETHLVKLPVFLAALAVIASIGWSVYVYFMAKQSGFMPIIDYWFFNLIFKW